MIKLCFVDSYSALKKFLTFIFTAWPQLLVNFNFWSAVNTGETILHKLSLLKTLNNVTYCIGLYEMTAIYFRVIFWLSLTNSKIFSLWNLIALLQVLLISFQVTL